MKSMSAICVATLTAITTVAVAGSAEAISFRITQGAASPTGQTNQGAYSEFAGTKGTTTIDFNSGFDQAGTSYSPVKDKNGNALLTYTFDQGMSTNAGQTGVFNDRWAPAGANGEVNASKYLAVFAGNMVKISFAKTMNYFGIDWGAISSGNTFSFFRNGQQVKTFTTADVNPVAPIKASQHGGEGNGYLHFYSQGANDIFDEIQITQAGGGGFESDNHSFHEGTDAFNFDKEMQDVPEPTMTLGLMATSSLFLLKRKRRKELSC